METEMDWIYLMCENREKEQIRVCPICGSDDIGYIPHDKRLIRI